jgi:hypothetical protein
MAFKFNTYCSIPGVLQSSGHSIRELFGVHEHHLRIYKIPNIPIGQFLIKVDGVSKHLVHVANVSNVPSFTYVTIKAVRVQKHSIHARYRGDVPALYFGVKIVSIHKQPTHERHLTDIPRCHFPVIACKALPEDRIIQ